MHIDPAAALAAVTAVRAYMVSVRAQPWRGYTDLYIASVTSSAPSAQQWARAELAEAQRLLGQAQYRVEQWPQMAFFVQDRERAWERVVAAEQLVDVTGAL